MNINNIAYHYNPPAAMAADTYDSDTASYDCSTISSEGERDYLPLDKKMIFDEYAFAPYDWVYYFNDRSITEMDAYEAFEALPSNIVEILNSPCNFFPECTKLESHFLFWIPKGMTCQRLGELAKNIIPCNATGYSYMPDEVLAQIDSKPTKKSRWVLMLNTAIPETLNKSYEDSLQFLSNHEGYKPPKTIHAIASILADYAMTRETSFSENEGFYTRCKEFGRISMKQETVMNHVTVVNEVKVEGQITVGGLDFSGLAVAPNVCLSESVGLAPVLKIS